MGSFGVQRVMAAVMFASITITWTRFHSTTYPYSILQPSSFRHTMLPNVNGMTIDYFFPSLGSFTTNVNVVASPAKSLVNQVAYFRSIDGTNVHRSGWLIIMGKKRPLIQADFGGLAGKRRLEQICFVANGTMWQLTASYDLKYRNLRRTMLRMLQSFRLDG
ncbi:MAG TPA: hypothetical protein VF221_02480 [Chloroflexota bacterium]